MAQTLKWSTDYLLETMTLDPTGTASYIAKNPTLPKLNHYFLVYQVWAPAGPCACAPCIAPSDRLACSHAYVLRASWTLLQATVWLELCFQDPDFELSSNTGTRVCEHAAAAAASSQAAPSMQVGNYTQDRYYYGRLEDMTADANPRPAYFTTTANGAPALPCMPVSHCVQGQDNPSGACLACSSCMRWPLMVLPVPL